MNLKTILKEIKKLKITGISDDTRYLQKGDLFVCRKGQKSDGHKYLEEAIKLGAKAVLSEVETKVSIPLFIISDLERNFPELLFRFYDYPQYEMKLIGITGTDGKTTTASITEYLLSQKYNSSYIGTNGIRSLNSSKKFPYTTLPLCLLIRTLRFLADKNIRHLVMEVSSQGLVNQRLEGLFFQAAIFTNLSHEHLDTHKTMDNYLKAKLQLFSKLEKKGLGMVNFDSPYAKYFEHKQLLTYGLNPNADFQAFNIREQNKSIIFDLKTPEEIWKNIKINLPGIYNIYNTMASIITALHFKIPKKIICKALENIPKIEGRLEVITTTEDFFVYVDFAHTPNALKEVLTHLKGKHKKLILVIGSAGEKDKSKRPLLGQIASNLADFTIFTAEDPRSEKPEDIISEMIKDLKTNNYQIILSRKEAIKTAINMATTKDAVLIAGKGNDDYYEEKGIIYPYSDIEEAEKALIQKNETVS
ncbi:MAG: UDP-N-acetylmuramoyl-L-alanyl-D-glutamate--2,6-diaminopimelate ligase [Bacilli bacterium]|nr:UDP-N-acetylmuramoyl-L-alanyl-D-glutamate--2,6-diaminopimelate ligase [Bacilli bacterium]